MMRSVISGAILLAAGYPVSALAEENGGFIYPIGADTVAPGILPPRAGNYFFHYTALYNADQTNDRNGDPRAIPNYDLSITGNAERWLRVWDQKIAGGSLVTQVIVPWATVDVTAGPVADERTTLGDVSVGAFVAWHSPKWHAWVGPNIYFPTGVYDADRAANVGRNYVAASLQGGVSHFVTDKIDVGVKGYIGVNAENPDTNYTSGAAAVLEYSAAYRINPTWRVGINGYYYDQFTDDKIDGQAVPGGNQGRTFAVGPMVQYNRGRFTGVIKYQGETFAENRAQGGRLWFQAFVPF